MQKGAGVRSTFANCEDRQDGMGIKGGLFGPHSGSCCVGLSGHAEAQKAREPMLVKAPLDNRLKTGCSLFGPSPRERRLFKGSGQAFN